MAITILWDKNDPANSEDPRNGAAEIRQLKQGLSERLNQGAGIFLEDPSGTDANAGKICAGLQAANLWRVFETNKTTVMLEFDDNANTCKIGDGKTGANPYEFLARRVSGSVTSFDKGADRDHAISIAAIAIGGTNTWPAAAAETTLTCSLEATPRVYVSGYVAISVPTAAVQRLTSASALQYQRNAGAWTTLCELSILARTNPIFAGAAIGDTLVMSVSTMMNNAIHGLVASDVLKWRWSLTADGANTQVVNWDVGEISAFELVQ